MLDFVKLDNINIKYNENLKNFIMINNKSCKILFQYNSNKLNYFNKAYDINIRNKNDNIIFSKNV